METRNQKISRVFELISLLKSKYTNYVSFSYVDGKEYERWSIYTGHINHNIFTDIDRLIVFMERLVSDESFYRTRDLDKLMEDFEHQQEIIRDAEEEKQRIQEYLDTMPKEGKVER